MRPIVSFCDQLSKCLTTVLKPLTEEWRHKLQSTENFIDAIKTVQVLDDYKLVSFDVKSLFTSIPLQLALDCTETAVKNSYYWTTATYRRLNGLTEPLSYFYVFSVQWQALQTVAQNSYGLTSFRCCCRNHYAKHRGTSPRNLQMNTTTPATLHWWYLYSRTQRRNWRFSRTPQRTKRRHTVYYGDRGKW